MITYTHKALMKIIAFVAIIVIALLFAGGMIGSVARELGPDARMEGSSLEEDDSGLETITASSSLEADMDAYLESSDGDPNPNEFNDSYSDLNR